MNLKFQLLFSSVFILGPLLAQEDPTFKSNQWQQEVNYTIEVTLDDTLHELNGFIKIEYINNSPDELEYIYFHLWPNAYKDNYTAFALQQLENGSTKYYYADPDQKGYIDKLEFMVDNYTVRWELDEIDQDIAKVYLNEPLKSGKTIQIGTSFHVKIPDSFSRFGHVGQSYQITQWYPKPAVYDATGWHPIAYLDQGEFYSEYGSFDVTITLPSNYVVGATGDLQNEEELDWMSKKAEETKNQLFKKEVVTVPASSETTKTLHYKQTKIHDFAWFADKNFYVMKGSVELPHSNRRVTTWALFTDHGFDLWKKATDYVSDAVYYYSLWTGDYPYNHCTAVEGALSAGGGMEYPNITIIGDMPSATLLERVIVHEVGHNWFYGILGSNERLHPWMDEGINTFYENRYFDTKYPEHGNPYLEMINLPGSIDLGEVDVENLVYKFQHARGFSQPIELPAEEFLKINYGVVVYFRSGIIFQYLMKYLGEEEFDRVMKRYYETWKFRHPQPMDLQLIFEEETQKYMGWFFDHLIQTTNKLDYLIRKVDKDTIHIGSSAFYKITIRNGSKRTIQKKNKVKGPYTISGMREGKVVKTVWYDGFFGELKVLFPYGEFDAFRVNADSDIPDINAKNNTIKTSGLFKRLEPFNLQPLVSFDDGETSDLTFLPVLGWNYNDKTMIGLAFYNGLVIPKKFEYVVMPMYGIGSHKLVGTTRLSYNWHPDMQAVRAMQLSLGGSMFNGNRFPLRKFQKVQAQLRIDLKGKALRSSVEQRINIRGVLINRSVSLYDTTLTYSDTAYWINEIVYSYRDNRLINPYGFRIALQQGKGFLKTSLTANYRFNYRKKKKGLDLRFFGGYVLSNTYSDFYRDMQFRMSGHGSAITGNQDYMYDQVFLGREDTAGIFSQQIAIEDGGFKVLTQYGQTDEWIVTANVKSTLRWNIPISIFADFGTSPTASSFAYDFGFFVTLVPGICDVYFPLLMSADLKTAVDFNKGSTVGFFPDGWRNYVKRISFTLNLNKIDPFTMIRNLRI
ncbi:MAG: M1 family metallopeptidase [Bacteroidetes bacterium]|nr:M1 family metallopeptidase [Bacteroidota bacterium]